MKGFSSDRVVDTIKNASTGAIIGHHAASAAHGARQLVPYAFGDLRSA